MVNLELARNGQTQYAIVTNTNSIPAEKTAAQELSDYLAKVTGARFEVMSETNAVLPSRAIYVGWTDFARKQGIDASILGEEEWIIKSFGENLVLTGGRQRGTLYAVYEFLEQQIGCRWFDAFTESIPSQPTLALKKMDIRGRPAFWYRNIWTGDDSCNSNHWLITAFKARNKEMVEWYSKYGRQNFYGLPGGSHTFYAYSKDWPTNHPEYLAMNDKGERVKSTSGSGPGQICLTHPEVRKLMLQQLKEFIVKDRETCAKEGRNNPPRIYAVEANDAHWICQCPECKALSEREGSDSGPMIDLVNYLADGVRTEFPNVLIDTFAYSNTLKPPKTLRPRDNVIIRLAQLNAEWAPSTNKLDEYPDLFKPMTNAVNRLCYETLLDWSRISKHMSIWDYWILCTMNDMGYPAKDRYQTPYINLTCIKSDLELFINNNIGVIYVECEAPETQSFFALKRWLGLKLMQDPRQPAEPLIATFMSGYYGPASSKMSEYLAYMVKRIGAVPETEKLSATQEQDRSYLDLDFYVTSIKLLDEAEAMCGTNKLALLHVQRERIPVDSGLLGMWDHLLKKLPAGQTMPFDRDAVLKHYETTRLTQMETFRSKDKMEDGKKRLEKELRKFREMALIEKRKAEKSPVLRVPLLGAEAAGGDPAKVDWTKAAALGSWGTLDGMKRPGRQINGAVAQDGKFFYISLEETLDPTNLTRNADIWSGDDWELFFAAQRGKAPYRQIGINPDGKHVGYEYAGIQDKSSAWTNNAIVKSDTTGGQWRVRMSIPLADLIPNGVKAGQPFYMNVFRATPMPAENMSWSPIFGKSFHDLNRLAELKLE